ncbi:FAD-dependent oxidoreductase [Actinomadura rubrisoli]|uniref:FAD-binding protein n=1 Tax=Actinomadura rubrisoli TaxID=2530368 RepID=A0A4R5AA65_9ACTN|nr:FAD-binding protein [Actinomadura rubrisoli]TDD69178.1 FAD-binding protein [Actinomadura rubrisoli]
MQHSDRRGFLALGATATLATAGLGSAAPAEADEQRAAAATITPSDPRYPDFVRGNNFRFAGTPDSVRVIESAGQIEQALAEAVHVGKRPAVRSGGHCLEGFTTDPSVKVVLDLSQYSGVYFDRTRGAVAVEAGATLGQVYDTLYKQWGTTVPGGVCPQVGVGGHISGGGYGALSRLFGLVVDHLEAVEVVVVDKSGEPRTVVATSSPKDPAHDLWWAHTGGGGGNFGVVSRYWLRSPGATGNAPARILPRPPSSLLISRSEWAWSGMDEAAYSRIVGNFVRWHEAHSAPGAPEAGLFATLWCNHFKTGNLFMIVQVDGSRPDAERILAGFNAAVTEGVAVKATRVERELPWGVAWKYLSFPDYGSALGLRIKDKSSYQRRAYSDAQLATVYKYVTMASFEGRGATMLLAGYGGQINAAGSDARAIPQRDSVIKAQYGTSWIDPAQDAAQLAWIRGFYRELFSGTGGVPVSGALADGAYINYPDVDLADPAWNTSGVPWSELYYKSNYARLRRAKGRWDPLNTFQHALGIQPPS